LTRLPIISTGANGQWLARCGQTLWFCAACLGVAGQAADLHSN
jgi:hypothetical protein